MKSHIENIENKLSKRKSENAFRELKTSKGLIDFCSNDYLGFASEKFIHQHDAIDQYGSTGSRLISGNNYLTIEVENYLANFYKAESALIYNSGYNANIGLFSCVAERNDTIIYDELIHASIRDGIRLSHAHSFSFQHNSIESLKEKINNTQGNVYVAVESIYSMDGDAAPLTEIVELCKEHQVALIVDEAHACGVFGSNGQGLVEQHNLQNEVFARIITFGKAFGAHGAIVLGSTSLRDYLINYSRAFIYTTALPLQSILTIKNAHDFLIDNVGRVKELRELIEYFKQSIKEKIELIDSSSAIQCVVIPGNDAVKLLASKIQEKGFDVRPILSPSVPKGEERLRICLHTFNERKDVDQLIDTIQQGL